MSTNATTLRWGILGAGKIAKAFATDLEQTDRGTLVAVASRSLDKAKAFAEPFGRGEGDGQLRGTRRGRRRGRGLRRPRRTRQHAEWAIKLLRAGKHVLCEKPLCANFGDAEAVVEAASASGRVLMEAFMYRCHPLTARLVELVRNGSIGTVQVIEAAFSFRAGDDPTSRLLYADLAGGGILDVGCYAAGIARLVAGAADGQALRRARQRQGGRPPWSRPASTSGPWPSVTSAAGSSRSSAPACRLTAENGLRVYGTDGSLRVDQPFIPARNGGAATIVLSRRTARTR